MSARLSLLLGLVSALCALYLLPETLALGFAGDDWFHIFSHMTEEAGLWANFEESWEHFVLLDRPTPMQPLMLAVLFELFGEAAAGYFVCGLGAIAIAGLLLGRLVYRLSKSPIAAVAATVIWVTVPVHTQSLYMLSAGLGKWQGSIYFLVSLGSYLNYLEGRRHRWGWALLSVLCFALTLGCYEQAITFLAAYPLVHWLWSRSTTARGRVFLGAFWLHGMAALLYIYVRTGVLSASNPANYHINSLGDVFSTATWQKMSYVSRFYAKIWDAHLDPSALWTATGFGLGLALLLIGLDLLRRSRSNSVQPTIGGNGKLLLLGLCIFVAGHGIYFLVSTGIDERSLVFPSIGMAIGIAAVVGALHRITTIRPLEVALAVLVAASGTMMANATRQSSEPYVAASKITHNVFEELKRQRGSVPEDTEVVILGTPWLAKETTWVFTADYSLTGCVVRALQRPTKDAQGHRPLVGRMAIVPAQSTYDCAMDIRNYPFGGYCINYYTKADWKPPGTGRREQPPQPYERLCMFLFDGSKLHRVSDFDFQDRDGNWHRRSLAREGVAYRQPRIASLLPHDRVGRAELQPELRSGDTSLRGFGITKVPYLLDTCRISLTWQRHDEGAFQGTATAVVHFRDADDRILLSYYVRLEQAELDRQLENRTWAPSHALQQELLIHQNSPEPAELLLQKASKVELVLQTRRSADAPGESTSRTFANPFR